MRLGRGFSVLGRESGMVENVFSFSRIKNSFRKSHPAALGGRQEGPLTGKLKKRSPTAIDQRPKHELKMCSEGDRI